MIRFIAVLFVSVNLSYVVCMNNDEYVDCMNDELDFLNFFPTPSSTPTHEIQPQENDGGTLPRICKYSLLDELRAPSNPCLLFCDFFTKCASILQLKDGELFEECFKCGWLRQFDTKNLKKDFGIGKVLSLDSLIIREYTTRFRDEICAYIWKILHNPVGRVLIRRIIDGNRECDKRIYFTPVLGFYTESASFRRTNFPERLQPENDGDISPPDIMAKEGDKFYVIPVPFICTNCKKIECTESAYISCEDIEADTLGIRKSSLSFKTIGVMKFASVLAHELMHCEHSFSNKEVSENRRLQKTTCRILEKKLRAPDGTLPFPNSEELYAVLGVYINVRKEQFTNDNAKLNVDDVSQFTYDLFDDNADFFRILYYNKDLGKMSEKQTRWLSKHAQTVLDYLIDELYFCDHYHPYHKEKFKNYIHELIYMDYHLSSYYCYFL